MSEQPSVPDAAAGARMRLPWRRRLQRRLPVAGLLLIMLAYAWIQVSRGPAVYFEPDPDAYLIMAKRLARFEPIGVVDPDPYMYQRHMWVENERGEIIAKYNPGFPFFLAIAWWLGGDDAMLWVSPFMGLLGILGVWLLARQWMRAGAATIATTSLTGCYMYLFYSGYMLTHSANLCCMVWGMYGLWRWRRHGGWWPAILAALGIGLAVSVRYTSVAAIAAVPWLVIARALLLRRQHADRRHWRIFLGQSSLGILIFAGIMGILCLYHMRWFGSPLTTGYDLSDEQGAFALADLGANYQMLAMGLVTCLGLLSMPLGLVGMAAVGSIWDRLARASWFLPLYLIYAAYYWAMPAVMYYRFMLVTFPVLVGSGFLILDRLPARRSWQRLVPMILVMLFCVGWQLDLTLQMFGPRSGQGRRDLKLRIAHACDDSLPPDSVLFLDAPFHDYICTRADYRAYPLDFFTGNANPYETGRWSPRAQPSRVARFQSQQAERTRDDQTRDLHAIIAARLAAGGTVAFVVPSRYERRLPRLLGGDFQASLVATIPTYTEADLAAQAEPPHSNPEWHIYRVDLTPSPSDGDAIAP